LNRLHPRHSWILTFVCGCALICGCALTGHASAAGPAPTPTPPPAPAGGVWSQIGTVSAPGGPSLRDSYGRRLQLEGVDVVAKCGGGARPQQAAGTPCVGPASGRQPAFILSPTARDPGRRFTAADAASLARLGFTVVRLGIVWEGLEPGLPGAGPNDPRYCAAHRAGTPFPSLGRADPYRSSVVQAYLASTDRIVSLLAAAGLRVIIDMHQDAYGSAFSDRQGPLPWNGEGAPPWATCTNGFAFPGRSYWGQAYGAVAVETAIRHFWHNNVRGDLQGQFARVWQAVATHYRDSQDVIGYDLFNEPDDLSTPHFNRVLQCVYAGRALAPRSCSRGGVQALPDGLIGAIEAADPNHLVLYEPTISANVLDANVAGIREPLRFPRLVLAFHVYGTPPPGVFGCPGRVCLRSERKAMNHFLSERNHVRTLQPGGPATILDEFGGGPSIPDIAQVAELARRHALSWTYWSGLQLHDPTGAPGENLLNDRSGNPWPAKARVLSGPYPLATAGRPGPAEFDPSTRSFTDSYTVDPAVSVPTDIVVPPYTYPDGYHVLVHGAVVVSAPNVSPLALSALPGSQRVEVKLWPGSG
jgi:endoglycosylceramidase